MAKPGVVHLNSLIDEVRDAVREAGGGLLVPDDPEIVMLPDPGIVGFVMSDQSLRDKNVGQLTDVATRIGRSVGGTGGLVVHDGNIIVGFIPPKPNIEK